MRHVRILGLCLAAAFAVAAVAASSAAAGPQFGKCEFVGSGGNYTGKNCNKNAGEKAKPKGSGDYEWVSGAALPNQKFEGNSVGSGGVLSTALASCTEETEPGSGEFVPGSNIRVPRSVCEEEGHTYVPAGETAGLIVECEAEHATGENEGKNKVANVHVKFNGCKVFGSIPCEQYPVEGAEEGEINTSELKGKLGWISKANKEVGVALEPAAHHGAFATFQCLNEYIVTRVGVGNKKEGALYVKGSKYPEGCREVCAGATPEEEKHGGYDQIISPITPINEMTTEFTQEYTENGKLENKPNKFEGKHISLLEDWLDVEEEAEVSEWSPASETVTNVNTLLPSGEESEIKA